MNSIKIITSLLLFYNIAIAQNPNSWSRVADFTGTPSLVGIAFSIDSFGYVGLGGYTTDTTVGIQYPTDFWQYNPYTNIWTQKANFPGVGRINGVSFVVGSKAYVGLGQNNSSQYLNDLWEYNPTADIWVQKANFSGGGRYLATGLSIGNKGYVVSGVSDTSNAMKDNWEYDPVADTWTQKANFEGAGRSAAIGFSIGGNGYVGLGYGLNSPAYYLTDFWQYDTAADSWVEKSDFPAGALDGAFTFVISDMGYVGTGADSIGKTHSNFCKYNSLTDQWTQKDSFGGGMRAWASGFSIGNNGYAGIGTPSNIENCMKDFWMYTPDSIATGIKSIDDNSIVIYPNPVSDKIHITSISNTFFSISDMAGQSWQVQIIGNEIDVSDLPSGVYCLRLQNSDGFLISKFTKL